MPTADRLHAQASSALIRPPWFAEGSHTPPAPAAGVAEHEKRALTRSNTGAPGGIRTPNLLIRSQMLYPLSHGCGSSSGLFSRRATP